MPRTWPSMWLSRLVNADLVGRATSGCATIAAGAVRDFIPGALDRGAQRGRTGPRLVEAHLRRPALQADCRVGHTWKRGQHARDAGDTTAAAHAFDLERNRGHCLLLVGF